MPEIPILRFGIVIINCSVTPPWIKDINKRLTCMGHDVCVHGYLHQATPLDIIKSANLGAC